MEQVATIDDFRLYGARFGIECAEAAKRKWAEGLSKKAIREHVAAMEQVKRNQLVAIGASDFEIDRFITTAGAACYAALDGDDLLGILNRRQPAQRRPSVAPRM
ncbi:MAG TPA: hypothetical protein VFA80_10360 [Xanthobacteraceae bacterium]|nr:hypothetical protein [Xanthobacteraceae bacterium]